MIKAIIFDYSGVIVRDESKTLSKIIEYLGTTSENWHKEWFLRNREKNTGKKSYQEYFLDVCSKFKNSETSRNQISKMLEEKKNGYKINLELIETIKDLKSRGYKIGLISNYGKELRDKLKDQSLYDLFDSTIISAEVGCQKPDPEIFKIAFSELGVKPKEVVFVDDSSNSLKDAEDIGYRPILFKGNESFRTELEKILEIKSWSKK